MAEPTSVSTPSLLSKLLTAAQFEDKKPAAALMIQKGFSKSEENADPTARFVSGLAAVLHNIDTTSGRYEKGQVLDVVAQIDRMVAVDAAPLGRTPRSSPATVRGPRPCRATSPPSPCHTPSSRSAARCRQHPRAACPR